MEAAEIYHIIRGSRRRRRGEWLDSKDMGDAGRYPRAWFEVKDTHEMLVMY